jgi:HEPN domain-containing protein
MDKGKFDLWFAEATNDFEMGHILFNAQKFNGAVFYYIQAAEKAVKALLYLFNFQPWGHSILNLLNEYEKKARKFQLI